MVVLQTQVQQELDQTMFQCLGHLLGRLCPGAGQWLDNRNIVDKQATEMWALLTLRWVPVVQYHKAFNKLHRE